MGQGTRQSDRGPGIYKGGQAVKQGTTQYVCSMCVGRTAQTGHPPGASYHEVRAMIDFAITPGPSLMSANRFVMNLYEGCLSPAPLGRGVRQLALPVTYEFANIPIVVLSLSASTFLPPKCMGFFLFRPLAVV